MPTRERFLLAVTMIGFIAPNVMIAVFVARHGVDIGQYLGDWTKTLPSAQLLVDLSVCCVALFAWAAWEGPRAGVRRWWVVFPATALVGLCFALPLFLLLRERAVRTHAGIA